MIRSCCGARVCLNIMFVCLFLFLFVVVVCLFVLSTLCHILSRIIVPLFLMFGNYVDITIVNFCRM